MLDKDELKKLSREKLEELLFIDSKNLIAMDGVWFQSIEKEMGMDAAMHHDEEAWKLYTRSEARRIKKFLGLPEKAGLDGLAEALKYRMVDRANPSENFSLPRSGSSYKKKYAASPLQKRGNLRIRRLCGNY